MNPSEVTSLIEHASTQSDRYLFVGALVVGGIALFFAARWLAGQYNRMLDQWCTDMKAMQDQIQALHAERVKAADAFAIELRTIQRENAENAKENTRAYTDALARNAEVMGGVQHALKDLQSSCAIARGSLATFPTRRAPDPSAP